MTVRLVDIVKTYPGTRALDGVTIAFEPGEVHAIVGENGAGKTTLVSILSGANQPTSGTIEIDGEPRAFEGPRAALDVGIAYVSQEGSLVPFFSGIENILLGSEPGRLGIVSRRQCAAEAQQLAERYFPGRRIDLDRPVETLDHAERKVVEILRALYAAAAVLILDEPTASLPAADKAMLAAALRDFKARGLVVILISHFLKEVLELADRVTIMRDGRKVETVENSGLYEAYLVARMIGRDTAGFVRPTRPPLSVGAIPRLKVEGLSGEGFHDVSLDVRPGEILGLIGLSEAGQIQFAEGIFSARGPLSGTVEIDGERVAIRSARDARRHGIGLVPDQRMEKALIGDATIRENLAVVNLPTTGAAGLPVVRPRYERAKAHEIFRRLQIKAQGIEQQIVELSGGNKQKVSIGRWLFGVKADTHYRILIFVEPTEGIDVGVKTEIHDIMVWLANAGVSVIVVSSDLMEIAALADRVTVFAGGRTVATIGRTDFSEDTFVSAMAGGATGRIS